VSVLFSCLIGFVTASVNKNFKLIIFQKAAVIRKRVKLSKVSPLKPKRIGKNCLS